MRFSNGQEAFPLTTAAQNMHGLLRKSPLCRSHFFEWLKTAISSNACGMSTLKSLLPQAFAVSDVHPRPRKRLARCTLDCGFKTSESPALRGFVGGPRALATAALYLVLLSNGLPHSKNLPVKFGFSPKTVSANIVKKLPPQRCSKPFFNFSHKRPTFAFTSESGHTSALGERSHTAAHTAKHGAFRMGALSLPSACSARSRTSPGRVSERQTFPLLGLGRVYARRTQRAFGTAMRLCASLFRGVAAPLGCATFLLLSKLRLVRPALRVFPRVRDEGWYHHSWCALRVAETLDGRLSKRLICRFLRLGSLH